VILFFGIPSEPPLRLAIEAAERAGLPHLVVNQRHAHYGAIGAGYRRGMLEGAILLGGARHDLGAMSGLYLRAMEVRQLPGMKRRDGTVRDPMLLARAEAFSRILHDWAEVAPGAVANRPHAMASNGSKPWQAMLIRAAGFDVPETLVTNDADAVRAFHARVGRIIFKSTSGIRSIVREWTPDIGLDRLRALPVQFQALVPGADVRVHVVGDAVFAHRVVSEAIDYRYGARDGLAIRLEAEQLPDDVAEACVRLAAALGLVFAGIDLRLSTDGRWFCFEVNPQPAYSWYEEETGQPIAAALVARLALGDEGCQHRS
jgi:hypothetical protein